VLASEGCLTGNAVCEVAMRVMEHGFDYLDAPPKRVCGADVPMPMSPVLEDAAVPSVQDIASAIRELAVG